MVTARFVVACILYGSESGYNGHTYMHRGKNKSIKTLMELVIPCRAKDYCEETKQKR